MERHGLPRPLYEPLWLCPVGLIPPQAHGRRHVFSRGGTVQRPLFRARYSEGSSVFAGSDAIRTYGMAAPYRLLS